MWELSICLRGGVSRMFDLHACMSRNWTLFYGTHCQVYTYDTTTLPHSSTAQPGKLYQRYDTYIRSHYVHTYVRKYRHQLPYAPINRILVPWCGIMALCPSCTAVLMVVGACLVITDHGHNHTHTRCIPVPGPPAVVYIDRLVLRLSYTWYQVPGMAVYFFVECGSN